MITFLLNLIRNPTESACPYLEGGTDSVSNKPSGFFRRDVDRVPKFRWLEEWTVILFIYWERYKYHFITRITLFMQFCLNLHFQERESSILYPKFIPSLGMAWQLYKKGKSWAGCPPPIRTLPLWQWHPQNCLCLFTSLCKVVSSGSKETRNVVGLGQGTTGDTEMCQLTAASSLWGDGRKWFLMIHYDLSASTLVSKETVKKVVFKVISASWIGMLWEKVTKWPLGLKHRTVVCWNNTSSWKMVLNIIYLFINGSISVKLLLLFEMFQTLVKWFEKK